MKLCDKPSILADLGIFLNFLLEVICFLCCSSLFSIQFSRVIFKVIEQRNKVSDQRI